MGMKKFKPTTPGRRFMTVPTFDEITKTRPQRTEPLRRPAGRNSQGKVTVRHRGGGHKRLYRIIDFKRDKDGVTAKVAAIEYDPNRSARLALLHYADGGGGPPAAARRSWPRRATSPTCACPRARCGWSCWTARRRLGRLGMPSMKRSRSARPAASAGWGGGRRCAGGPWILPVTRTAAGGGAPRE